MERLQKILSRAGIASRRASERLMLEGRVTVNGVTVSELGAKADASSDDIRVDGRRIHVPSRHLYLLLNKPRGYVTTRSDPQHRPTVIDLVGIREYVYPVGRLDYDSEGLLLLTNDGDLAAKLMHPRHGVERVYEAEVLGAPDDHDLSRLRRGVLIEGRPTDTADITIVAEGSRPGRRQPSPPRAGRRPHAPAGRERGHSRGASRDGPSGPGMRAEGRTTLRISIREGRNRQVRKMFDAIGHPVDRLRRVAIGPIRDARLKPGQWRELTAEEVERLRKSATQSAPRTQRTQRS
jgi:pseudouridine synthase